MIRSSHRDRKTKAIAEVLAMIADAHPKLAPNHPRPARRSDDWLFEDATEFCAALDRYAGGTPKVFRGHAETPGVEIRAKHKPADAP